MANPNLDPTTVPIRPAATILLIDDRPKLQILMMKRTRKLAFAGDMWVFPGGKVDPSDSIQFDQICRPPLPAMPDAEAQTQAFCVAVIREAFEEAGLLIACPKGQNKPLNFSANAQLSSQFQALRHKLNAGTISFYDMLNQNQLQLATDRIQYAARWITPLGSPQRFDARFFVAKIPTGQQPMHDNSEIVQHEWFQPTTALQMHKEGRILMMAPTVAMIAMLTQFECADNLLTALAKTDAHIQVRVQPDNRQLIYPSDSYYQKASESIEFGWMRITPKHPVKATSGLPPDKNERTNQAIRR